MSPQAIGLHFTGTRVVGSASIVRTINRSCVNPIVEAGRRGSFRRAAPGQLDGAPVNVLMYLGGFAEYVLVASQCGVPVPDAVPFDRACLLGCGVMTGLGGATNVADVGFGDSVAVIGCGAIGLAAVQGARLRGAATIIAVDLDDGKLDLACCMVRPTL